VKARRRSDALAAAGAVLVFVCAAVLAARLGTWTDEEYTLATTAHGAGYALDRALTYELQAPLYFVLEAVWREANGSLLWARVPSLLCATGLFFAFRAIGRRLAPDRDPLAFALLATLNPVVVFAAFEIRLYAFALLLASVMWLLFDAAFIAEKSARARVGFVIATIAAIYVQYFLGFALAGFALTLIVRRERAAFVPFAVACLPIVIAAAPLAVWAHRQVGGYETDGPTVSFLLRHTLLHPWVDFVFPYERDWDVVAWPRKLYDASVALAFVAVVAVRPRPSRQAWAWIAGAVAVELTYLALLAGLRLELDDRHYVALYVPLAVAAYALATAPVPAGRVRPARVFVLTAFLTAAVLITRYRHVAQPGDWQRVGAYLEGAARPGDAIVVYAADALPALARQYHGNAPLVPFPKPPSTATYSADLLVVHSQAEAIAALDALHGYAHLWFVSDVRCRSDEQSYGCVNVQPAIDRTFTVERKADFYETRVEELAALPGKRTRTNAGTSLERARSTRSSATDPIREKSTTLIPNDRM